MSDIVERLLAGEEVFTDGLRPREWIRPTPKELEAAAEIERLREFRAHMKAVVEAAGFGSITEALVEIERLRARLAEAVEVVRGLMEWAEPLAGDNCDPLAASEETRSVEFARAFLAKLEGRSGE